MSLPPFEVIVTEHSADLHRLLVASVGVHEADDCFQEVMLAALRAYPDLRDASNLRGWLFTIAYNKAIDSHRARGRRAQPAGAVGRDLADDRELDALAGQVWRSVGVLPPKQRAALICRFLYDLPYREIGEIVECNEAAARQNVRAARAALREDLVLEKVMDG